MARPAFVQKVANHQGSNTTVSSFVFPSMTMTAGNLSVVAFNIANRGFGSFNITSVADTQGNSYSNTVGSTSILKNSPNMFGGIGEIFYMFYKIGVAGGTGTCTVTFDASYTVSWDSWWFEYTASGTTPVSYIVANGSGGSYSNNTTLNSGTSVVNTIIGLVFSASNSQTASSLTDRTGGTWGTFGTVGDQTSTAPSGEAVTQTLTGSDLWVSLAINFPQPSAASGANAQVIILG